MAVREIASVTNRMNHQNLNDHHENEPAGPGLIAWFVQQLGWYLRKLVLWPVADSFRWVGRGISRFVDGFRHRSPFAYIGATLAVTVTAGAVAAAVYFYNQSEQADPPAPAVAQQTADQAAPTGTVVPPQAPAGNNSQPQKSGEPTLQGVVPSFDRTAATRKDSGKKAAEKTVVKPSAPPESGPLSVAHSFATTFVGYEVGEKKASRELKRTASSRLARELRSNPPRLPAGSKVPKATVMNVVKGKRNGKRLAVSVALLRTGATSELRLALTRTKDSGWRVSEVRG